MNKTEERIDNNGPIHLQIDDDREVMEVEGEDREGRLTVERTHKEGRRRRRGFARHREGAMARREASNLV